MQDSVAVNILGTIGTVLWCIQLIPQIIRNYRVKDCEGLPPLMLFLWTAAGVPFSIYFVGIDASIPLKIQPQLFTLFCGLTWIQSLYYPPVKMSIKRILMIAGFFTVISAALEVGLILWLRPLYRRGIKAPLFAIGVIASVLIAIGLLPPYFELAKRKGRVIGINFVFLATDSLGALFSMLSVLIGTFDALEMTLYVIVMVLEAGIAASHIIWWYRFGRHEPKEDKEKEIESDGSLAAVDSDESSNSIEKKDTQDVNTAEMKVSQTLED